MADQLFTRPFKLQNNPWKNCRNTTILELSFKLKEAYAKVFGCTNFFLNGINFEGKERENKSLIFRDDTNALYDSDDSKNIFYNYQEKSIININEIYRKYDASFPRIISDYNEYKSNNFNIKNDFIFSDKEFEDLEKPELKKHSCNFCNYSTNSKSHLIRHQRAMHPTYDNSKNKINNHISKNYKILDTINRKFKCDMCQYQTDCKSHLRRHVGSVHSKEKPYQCQHCFIEFSRSEKIKEHHYNFHSDMIFDLKKSRKWFSINSEVHRSVTSAFNRVSKIKKHNKHSKIVGYNESNILNPPILNISTNPSRKMNAKKNKIKKHKRILRCLNCAFTCRDIWHLKRHILKIHSSIKEYNCKVCKYASNREQRIIAHMRGHGELFCLYCDFSSMCHQIFNKHFQICSSIKKTKQIFNCKICDFECLTAEEHIIHARNDHFDIQYFCNGCTYIADNDIELQNHSSLHSFYDFVCLICNEIFETIEYKNIHDQNMHLIEDSKQFSCTACSFQCNDIYEIKSHLLIHVAKKKLCKIMNCTFQCFGNLAFTHHKKYFHEEFIETSLMNTILSKKINNFDSNTKKDLLILKNQSELNSDTLKINKDIVMDNSVKNNKVKKNILCLTESDDYNDKNINDIEISFINEIDLKDKICSYDYSKITPFSLENSEISKSSNIQFNSDSSNKRKILACKKYGDYELETPMLNHITQIKNMPFSHDNLPASGIFNCPHCFERPPFRYRKSFEKHMSTHNVEKLTNKDMIQNNTEKTSFI